MRKNDVFEPQNFFCLKACNMLVEITYAEIQPTSSFDLKQSKLLEFIRISHNLILYNLQRELLYINTNTTTHIKSTHHEHELKQTVIREHTNDYSHYASQLKHN